MAARKAVPQGRKLMSSRRKFLRDAGLASVAGPLFIPASALGRGGATPPSDRISMACIGLGWMGYDGHLKDFLKLKDVRIVAVCDLDEGHLTRGKALVDTEYGDQGCTPYHAFEEVLMRRDVDAVSIALPDHWHGIVATQAARAQKGHLLREAAGAQLPRGPRHGRGERTPGPHLADRQLAAVGGELPPCLRTRAQWPHRQDQGHRGRAALGLLRSQGQVEARNQRPAADPVL